MKYIFFLIPFLLIVSFGIYQDVFALEVYRGESYQDIDYGNKTHVWTGGLSPYTETGNFDLQGRKIYTHHIVDDQPTYVKVTNGVASFVFDKLTCSAKIYDGGLIEDSNVFIIASDSFVPKSSIDGSGTWSIVDSVNDATCVTDIIETANSIEISGTKTSAAGIFKVRYVKVDGKPLESFLEATNLTALQDRHFGVTQTMQIPQIVSWGDQLIDLENFVGQTKDRTWLENNQANLLEFSQGLKFDTLKAWDNLESVSVNSVSNGLASISFNYIRNTPILLPNETLVIDPTYSSNDPIQDEKILSTSTSGTSCGSASSESDGADLAMFLADADVSGTCQRSFIEWTISSIPDSVTITDTDITVDIETSTLPVACAITQNHLQLSTMAFQAIWDDIANGTAYVNSTWCNTVSDNVSVDLGASADTEVQARLTTGDWFGIGLKFNDETRTSTGSRFINIEDEESAGTPDPTLTVTYTENPVFVVDLLDVYESSSTTLDSGTPQCLNVDLESASSCGTTLYGGHTYRFEVEVDNTGTAAGSPTSFQFQDVVAASDVLGSIAAGAITNAGCSTNTNWTPTISTNDLVLTSGTTCSISASGNQEFWFIVTLDTDLASGTGLFYVTNGSVTDTSTTTTFTAANPISILDLTYANLEQTSVDLIWTQPNLQNQTLINYRVNYTTPYGSPLTFLTNTSNTYANVTGLSDNTQYSFRAMVLTDLGYGTGGNILNVTTNSFLEIGNLTNPDIANTDDFQIFFERDEINATALYLNVTYSDTYDLSCDFAYQLARTNTTYSNLANVTVDAENVESSFLLINATGDIINVRCYDEITGDESFYVITITDFPFLQQIDNLRNGTYGTAFKFGAIDGVILVVLILSMIGFNRTNPAAGVIFLVITVGVLSYFGIITYPIIMYPALALLVLWAVITTRKDD